MLWMRHIDHIFIYGQQPMLWMDHIFIIWTDVMDDTLTLYGQQPMLWMRHIDHIFIIWTTTDVMDDTHRSYIHYMDNNRCYG